MGVRNYLLEITSLWEIILYKTDFATLTVLSCANSWPVCFSYRYFWKNSPNKLTGKSTTPATSKMDFCVALVNAVNYCHKCIYYKCYRGPRHTSETSYYKKFIKEL